LGRLNDIQKSARRLMDFSTIEGISRARQATVAAFGTSQPKKVGDFAEEAARNLSVEF
jgi:hypothetical protein